MLTNLSQTILSELPGKKPIVTPLSESSEMQEYFPLLYLIAQVIGGNEEINKSKAERNKIETRREVKYLK